MPRARTSGIQSRRQRHPFAITIREAPFRVGVRGGRGLAGWGRVCVCGEIFMSGAFTRTPMQVCDSADILSAGLWDGAA